MIKAILILLAITFSFGSYAQENSQQISDTKYQELTKNMNKDYLRKRLDDLRANGQLTEAQYRDSLAKLNAMTAKEFEAHMKKGQDAINQEPTSL